MIADEETPANTAKGSLMDHIQTEAWNGMIRFCIHHEGSLKHFTAETGITVPAIQPRNPMVLMIDRACGHDPYAELRRFVRAFIRWATKEYWGEDQITPSIREILDRLPEDDRGH